MKGKISLVINTFNEEELVADCIRSAQSIADEVIVCDMHSADRTIEIARGLGAKVVLHERRDFVELARHYAISQAQCEWVLVLDVDERLTPKLAQKLKDVSRDDRYDVVLFWSLYWYFGDWVRHGGFFYGSWPRFFRKQVYLDTYNPNEELIHHNFSSLERHPRRLQLSSRYYIEHYAYESIEKYCAKTLGRYARIEAEGYYRDGRKFSYARLFGDPLYHVLRSIFVKMAPLGGTRCLIMTVLQACYRFSLWANLWVLEDNAKRMAVYQPVSSSTSDSG